MFNDIIPNPKVNKELLVFLGGTCNDTTWRDKLMPKLKMKYFNPVVDDWTPEAQEEELQKREEADFVLYVISPAMTGVYSIAEVVDDSNKRPLKSIFCYLRVDTVGDKSYSFTPGQIKSLDMVGQMVRSNGGTWLQSLADVVNFLNAKVESS